jgi:hypothetical protein
MSECPECFSPVEVRILSETPYRFCTNASCVWRGIEPPITPPQETRADKKRRLRKQRKRAPNNGTFDGETHDPRLDHDRLKKQIGRVWSAMSDGGWRTLSEIAAVTGDPEASISARLRDLRKPRFGDYKMESRRRTDALWEYRILPGTHV